MSYLQKEIKNSVAVLTLDKPGEKVNTLDESMMVQFSEFLDELNTNDELRGAVLISGKKDNFIASARSLENIQRSRGRPWRNGLPAILEERPRPWGQILQND